MSHIRTKSIRRGSASSRRGGLRGWRHVGASGCESARPGPNLDADADADAELAVDVLLVIHAASRLSDMAAGSVAADVRGARHAQPQFMTFILAYVVLSLRFR